MPFMPGYFIVVMYPARWLEGSVFQHNFSVALGILKKFSDHIVCKSSLGPVSTCYFDST